MSINYKRYLPIAAAVFIVSSVIFLFVGLPESVPIFLIISCLGIVGTLTFLGEYFNVRVTFPKLIRVNLQIFLIFACLILIGLQIFGVSLSYFDMFLYLVVFVFSVGFSLLTLLKIKVHLSSIDQISLVYPLSIAVITIFGTAALLSPENYRGLLLTLFAFCLLVTSFLLTKQIKVSEERTSKINITNEHVILLLILLIAVSFYALLYPGISHLFGLDITDNYLQALSFSKVGASTFLIPNTLYPLFSVYESTIIQIAHPSVELFQTVTVLLNIFGILTFYSMARAYLKQYNTYAPIIATLIWSTFAGFGWLNYAVLSINSQSTSLSWLIGSANTLSYGDLTWRRNFFYLALEVSLSLVFAFLYFLKRKDLPRKQQIVLMTILLIPLPLMHAYALYFLFVMLLCLGVLSISIAQLRNAAVSMLLAIPCGLTLNYLLKITTTVVPINYTGFGEYFLVCVALFIVSAWHPKTLKLSSAKTLLSKCVSPAVYALVVLYGAAIALVVSGSISLNTSDLDRFGIVPLIYYPIKLGVSGLLAILILVLMLKDMSLRTKELTAVIVSFVLMILLSQIISTIQLQYVSQFTFDPHSSLYETIRQTILNFREERMYELIKIPVALIASIVIAKLLAVKKIQKNSAKKYALVGVLISIILISGTASTLLGLEYYNNQTKTDSLSQSELSALGELQQSVYANGKATIITPTPASYLDYTGATQIVTESTAAWASKSAEFPLFVTTYSKTTPTYFYLQKSRDYQALYNYENNYLQHRTNVSQVYLENNDVQVNVVNDSSIPVSNSNTALLIPYDTSEMEITKPFYQTAYDQYTTAELFFNSTLKSGTFSNPETNYTNVAISQTALFNGINSCIRINGAQANFDKIVVEFAFTPLNVTTNQVIAAKFDYGTPSQKSWEIAQYGQRLSFKISSDGSTEQVLSTGEILQANSLYNVVVEYDGNKATIFVNNALCASAVFQGGIFKSDVDLTVGAELNNNSPRSFANIHLDYIKILNDVPDSVEQVFYAYDLLSSMGFNYTTVLSQDKNINQYSTIILPYDDITTEKTLADVESNGNKTSAQNVIILNLNGYGPLLNLFGNTTDETFMTNQIASDGNQSLQSQTDVQEILPNNNVSVLLQYQNGNSTSPLFMVRKQNSINLIYVNLYPLLYNNQLSNSNVVHILQGTFSSYLGFYDDSTITSWFTKPSLLYSTFEANGTVSIYSDSIASITLPENKTLSLSSGDSINVSSTNLITKSGYGFYTVLTVQNASITLNSLKNTTLFISGNTTFVLRQPEISVSGTIKFNDFYMLQPPTIYTDSRTTSLSGNINFQVYVSDKYSIALPYEFNSKITVTYEKSLVPSFNELVLVEMQLPYILIIVIIILPLIALLKLQKAANVK